MGDVLNFFTTLVDDGYGYSNLCTARSALASSIILPGYKSLSDHPLVSRYIKGVFNLRPPAPKYSVMWDASVLLNYLKGLGENSILSFKDLTFKTAALLSILAGKRVHDIHKISVASIDITESIAVCHISGLLKQTRPNYPNKPIKFKAFHDKSLCPVACLREYMRQRAFLVSADCVSLFVTYIRPHRAASKDSLSRWVKCAMKSAGIDIGHFGPGSCRSASTSKGIKMGVPLDLVLSTGSWSNASTFYTFYCREIIASAHADTLGDHLLQDVDETDN